ADGGMSIGRGKALLALAPGILDATRRRDVLHAIDCPDDAAVVVEQRLDMRQHPDAAAVVTHNDRRAIPYPDPGLEPPGPRPFARRNERPVGAIEATRAAEAMVAGLRRDAPQLFRPLVVAQQSRIGPADERGQREHVDHGPWVGVAPGLIG